MKLIFPQSPPTKLPREPRPAPSPSVNGDETDYNSPPRKRFSPGKSQFSESLSTTKLPRDFHILKLYSIKYLAES